MPESTAPAAATLDDDDTDPDAPVSVADEPREPTEYERKLRRDRERFRRERNEARTAAEAEKTRAAAEIERVKSEAVASANERVLMAEMRAIATKAGMVDLDGIKLIDMSGVKFSDAGDVVGADAAIEVAKKAKPWLFGAVSTSSAHAAPKAPDNAGPKSARDMTADELKSFERLHGIRR